MAARGDREAALQLAQGALQWIDPSGPGSRNWTASSKKVLSATCAGTMGHIYAALAASNSNSPADTQTAKEWLQKAIQGYRELEGAPTYSSMVSENVALSSFQVPSTSGAQTLTAGAAAAAPASRSSASALPQRVAVALTRV